MSDTRSPVSSKIDLSAVPEPMRSLLLKQLERLPEAMRDKLLQEGSPWLERMIAKAREHAGATIIVKPTTTSQSDASAKDAAPPSTKSRPYDAATPKRTPTVSPGDSGSNGMWLLATAIGIVVAIWYAFLG